MRIGIVGSGIRGQLFAASLADVQGVQVAGMCDPSEAARQAAQKRFGPGMTVLPHFEQLYDDGVDAVIVATPDFAHLSPALAAAERGIHLMIEKPLATTSGEAEQIRKSIEANGATCLVAFENRWNPHFLKLKSVIDAGELGEVISVRGTLSNTCFVPEQMLSWAASSSPAWFLMPHILDLAMWITGSAPEDVSGYGHRGVLAARGIDTWDHVDALIQMRSGAIANLQTSWVLPTASPHIVDFRVEVIGTNGTSCIDMNNQGIRTTTDRIASHWPLPATIDGAEHGMAQWMVRDWARSLLDSRVVGPDASHGAVVTKTIEKLHEGLDSKTR